MKQDIFVDMDGVIADFYGGMINIFPLLVGVTDGSETLREYANKCQAFPGFYRGLQPIPDSLNSVCTLEASGEFKVYFASAPSWDNPHSYSEKREWIGLHLPNWAEKRLILTHNKGCLTGRALIDDRTKYGADEFNGEFIHYGSEQFPEWGDVISHLFDLPY